MPHHKPTGPTTDCRGPTRVIAHVVANDRMLPTVRDLKKTVQFNLIKNNPCTLEDIQVAEQIWGPDIEPQHLKGRGRRKKPTPSTLDMVKLPPEVKTIHREVHLFMDVMWVCGLPFLTSISANIMHRTATFIEDRKAMTLCKCLDSILHHCNSVVWTPMLLQWGSISD